MKSDAYGSPKLKQAVRELAEKFPDSNLDGIHDDSQVCTDEYTADPWGQESQTCSAPDSTRSGDRTRHEAVEGGT